MMKKKLLLLFMIANSVSMMKVNAQVRVAEPEFEQQVMLLTSDSTAVLLDKEKCEMKSHSSSWGLIPLPGTNLLDKVKIVMRLSGKEAKVKTHSGKIRLIVRVEKNTVDPADIFGVVKFEEKKKSREYVYTEGGVVGGTKLNFGKGTEKFKGSKYGTSSYLIEIADVRPGQYGLSATSLLDAATFGVE